MIYFNSGDNVDDSTLREYSSYLKGIAVNKELIYPTLYKKILQVCRDKEAEVRIEYRWQTGFRDKQFCRSVGNKLYSFGMLFIKRC